MCRYKSQQVRHPPAPRTSFSDPTFHFPTATATFRTRPLPNYFTLSSNAIPSPAPRPPGRGIQRRCCVPCGSPWFSSASAAPLRQVKPASITRVVERNVGVDQHHINPLRHDGCACGAHPSCFSLPYTDFSVLFHHPATAWYAGAVFVVVRELRRCWCRTTTPTRWQIDAVPLFMIDPSTDKTRSR